MMRQIGKFVVPPSIYKQQTEIVRRAEELFAFADQIEQRVKDAQARIDKLSQSILAKAFRNDLTATWRAANPALITGENSVFRGRTQRSLWKTAG